MILYRFQEGGKIPKVRTRKELNESLKIYKEDLTAIYNKQKSTDNPSGFWDLGIEKINKLQKDQNKFSDNNYHEAVRVVVQTIENLKRKN